MNQDAFPALQVPWAAGDRCRLEVAGGAEAKPVATWELEVARGGEESWLLTSRVVAHVRAGGPEPSSEETCTVEAHKTTLAPLRVEYLLRHGSGQATYEAVYGEGKARIRAEIDGERRTAEVVLPEPPYFDNEQFVMVLRALPLAVGFATTLNTIVTKVGSKMPVTIHVVKMESLVVPAGPYRCWVVELKGHGQRAWIACDPPRQLVRFTNEDAKTDARLVDHVGGLSPGA
jgi:hypothetical protein